MVSLECGLGDSSLLLSGMKAKYCRVDVHAQKRSLRSLLQVTRYLLVVLWTCAELSVLCVCVLAVLTYPPFFICGNLTFCKMNKLSLCVVTLAMHSASLLFFSCVHSNTEMSKSVSWFDINCDINSFQGRFYDQWFDLSQHDLQRDLIHYKHSCVLLNTGLSNASTKTGICTSLKSYFYFRFHSPLNTKSALPNFSCTWNLVLIRWKMWSP